MACSPKIEPSVYESLRRMPDLKRKRHTPEQIVKKLRVASEELGQGKELGEVCR